MFLAKNNYSKLAIAGALLTLAFFFHSLPVFANEDASAAHNEHEGIPIVVLYQAINIVILFGALYFKLRKPVSEFFANKRTVFMAAEERANAVLRQAEQEHHEIRTRLAKLEETRNLTIDKARVDALQIKRQILADAETLSKRLQEEANSAARIEVVRAKAELRETLIRDAYDLATRDISGKATQDDQKRLQQDFISKVQVVK